MSEIDIQANAPRAVRRLDALLNRDPPERLYHYTDQVGLLGIVETGQLWATKVQYMNDTTEFSLSIKLAKDRLIERLKSARGIAEIGTLNTTLSRLDGIANVNICSVSFCEDPDLLSQWRGYAGIGGGIAIGFRSQSLAELATKERGRLGHCIYDEDSQNAIIDEIINELLDKTKDFTSFVTSGFRRIASDFDNTLIYCGAFFKDKGFREESEWRLVTGITTYADPYFCFRPGKSMLVPFYKLQMKNENWGNEICSATIGPCPHPATSEQAVTGLFIKHGISDGWSNRVNIARSRIPYRNW